MNTFTFVRHGQSQGNLDKVIVGITDVPLTDYGISQAREVALSLASKSFDIIFCSNLFRARQTADEIIKYHSSVPFIVDKRLAERNYGIFENVPYDKINNDVDGSQFWDTEKNIIVKDAETFLEYYTKIKSFFDEINNSYKNKKILIITHGGVNRIIKYMQEQKHKNLISENIANTLFYDFTL